jgi:hypothetical protein
VAQYVFGSTQVYEHHGESIGKTRPGAGETAKVPDYANDLDKRRPSLSPAGASCTERLSMLTRASSRSRRVINCLRYTRKKNMLKMAA